MPYDPTVPATGHVPAEDYDAMRGNFIQINTDWAVDHINLGSSPAGYSNKTTYQAQAANPGASLSDGKLFTRLQNSKADLFFSNMTSGPSNVCPISPIGYGTFDTTGGGTLNVRLAYNVTITRPVAGTWTVAFVQPPPAGFISVIGVPFGKGIANNLNTGAFPYFSAEPDDTGFTLVTSVTVSFTFSFVCYRLPT